MNSKIIGASVVLSVVILYFVASFFTLGVFGLFLVGLVMLFAMISVVSLLYSVLGTLSALKQEPPLKEKVEQIKAKRRVEIEANRKASTQEITGRLEQLIAQGKDPFETGIQNLDKITKPPAKKTGKVTKAKSTAKKAPAAKSLKKLQNQKK